jgi:hypothetical protein
LLGSLARQSCPAVLPGSLALQSCLAVLPGSLGLARQSCPAVLPGSLAWQSCPAVLPGSLARQSCPVVYTSKKYDQTDSCAPKCLHRVIKTVMYLVKSAWTFQGLHFVRLWTSTILSYHYITFLRIVILPRNFALFIPLYAIFGLRSEWEVSWLKNPPKLTFCTIKHSKHAQ